MLKMMMPSMPSMPGGGDSDEKKEESAESREEKKEQVSWKRKWLVKIGGTIQIKQKTSFKYVFKLNSFWPFRIFQKLKIHTFIQEALRAKALKEQEKERKEFYDKQKMGMKDNRAKYREKVSLDI